MKTNFFKALGLPIAAFVLASAGAVSTDKSTVSKADDVLIDGYIHQTSESSCELRSVDCNLVSGAPCTLGAFTVWQKATQGPNQPCTVPMYKN